MEIKNGTKLKVVLYSGAIFIGSLAGVELYWPGPDDAPGHPAEGEIYLIDNVCEDSWTDDDGAIYDGFGVVGLTCDQIKELIVL